MRKSTGSAGASVWTFALLAGASLLLSFACAGPVSAQAVNRPPSVAVTPGSVTVEGGGTVDLDATASDLDNDPLTYAWTASPNVGSFADASRLDTVWTAPAAADNAQPVALTLTGHGRARRPGHRHCGSGHERSGQAGVCGGADAQVSV